MKQLIAGLFVALLGSMSQITLAQDESAVTEQVPLAEVSVAEASVVGVPVENEAPVINPIEALLDKLAKAKLSKAAKIVAEIEDLSEESLLNFYEVMLAGELYYLRENYRVVEYTAVNGEKIGIDILSGENLGELSKKQVKKIRVNNKLRKTLKGAIARHKLRFGSDEEKIESANFILENIDAKNIAALKEVLETESEASLRNAYKTTLALYDLKNSDERGVRLDAIELLSGNLESTVRNELVQIVEQDDDGEYLESDVVVRRAAQKELKAIEGKISFYGFVENLFFGLSAGSVLLLAAIGLAITFGVMGVINMAHGEMIMLGAYTTYVIQQVMPNLIEYSILVAIPAAFIVSALVGMLIEYLVIRRLHGRPLETLLATFGISLILMQTVRTIFSPLNVPVSTPEWMSGFWEVNPVLALTFNRIYILIFSLIVFAALMFILNKTSLGLRVRAVSQNRAMAKSLGVKTEWVDSMTFGLGSGIAGVAGVALSQITNVGPNLGQAYIIDSFMVVVFGGVGNILGTFFGGFSLGVANKFLEPATGAVLAKILVLVFIILFIQRRPKGLFPQKGRAAE